MRPRQYALVALVLGLTVASFFFARMLAERDVRRDSERRADLAAAQIRSRVAQAASLTESLRRFMLDAGGTGVTSDQFATNALRWLSPADFPAAAWVERIPDARRASYERRLGEPIVTPDEHRVVPTGSRRSYLSASLVSGFPPLALPGIDLSRQPGMATAMDRATRLGRVTATPVEASSAATSGIFLVAAAPNLVGDVLRRGHVVVFVPDAMLESAATGAAARTSTSATTRTFTVAGQRFDVAVPRETVHGAAKLLPWILLVAGLVLAALAAALGVNRARRARTQEELDRLFTLIPEMIAVADFNGYFTRVNPAAEQILGFTEEELLARPYLEFVHPDDRERTVREAAAITGGQTALSFENRYIRKDGTQRVLQWTTTPVVDDGVMYGVARDVTERREAERQVERLAAEQAALRRVATLVARDVQPAEVFAAVAAEVEQLLDAEAAAIVRLERDSMVVVASGGAARDALPVGTRHDLRSETALGQVLQTGRPARVENLSASSEDIAERVGQLKIRCSSAVPIVVDGALWGSIGAGWDRERFPADAQERLEKLTELVATAIAKAESKSELAASRRRIVAASDEARRRIQRNLHDGTQQRLMTISFAVRAAATEVPPELDDLRSDLSTIDTDLKDALTDLQQLSRGIHPTVLTRGGLGPAVRTLVGRSSIPVKLEVAVDERLPEPIEVAAYYVTSEALANAAKHAQASRVEVTLRAVNGSLQLLISDDGIGGADYDRGSGLVGLRDRVEALGGTIRTDSPPGRGTLIAVTLPLKPSHAE